MLLYSWMTDIVGNHLFPSVASTKYTRVDGQLDGIVSGFVSRTMNE